MVTSSTVSQEPPPRTGSTSLLEAELLLLDFLFDCRASWRPLREANYAFCMNVRYGHGLSDGQVMGRLRSLGRRGLLASRRDGARQVYALTRAGGAAWEAERLPDWSRYVVAWLPSTLVGTARVLAASRATAERYVRAQLTWGGWRTLDGSPPRVRAVRTRPVPWKATTELVELRIRVDATASARDRDALRDAAEWWSSVPGLAQLQRRTE